MKKAILTALVCTLILSAPRAQKLVSAQQIDFSTAATLNFVAGGAAQYDVTTFKVTYNTVNVDGTPTMASGAITIPLAVTCDSLSIIAYNHGTVLEDDDVPSENNTESLIGKVLASTGFMAVMPDYLGLGDHPGPHPYLHAASQATATLDLIDAAREYLRDSTALSLTSEVFVTGYSQGGHAAMATVKYVQENNLLNTYDIKAALPASGPYNFSKSQAAALLLDPILPVPAFYAYFVVGQNLAFNLYNQPSEFFKSPYDSIVIKYTNGQYPLDSLNSKLPGRLSQIMEDSVRANFIADSANKNHPLWQAILAADNYDWKPSFPMRLYYCSNDNTVNPQNSLTAEQAMLARAADVKAYNIGAFNHGTCVLPAISAIGDYIDTNSVSCSRALTLPKNRRLAQMPQMYPNPAQNTLFISSLPENAQNISLQIFNIQGQELRNIKGRYKQYNISGLAPGVYVIRWSSAQYQNVQRIVKQ